MPTMSILMDENNCWIGTTIEKTKILNAQLFNPEIQSIQQNSKTDIFYSETLEYLENT